MIVALIRKQSINYRLLFFIIIDDFNLFISLLKLASRSKTIYQHTSTP